MSQFYPQTHVDPEEPSTPEVISITPDLPDDSELPDYLLCQMANAAYEQDCGYADDAADFRRELQQERD
tara:strand:+ start:2357 stop:2563 length:207 start_codon:yes stop_codon:yes gene_type:complete